MSFESVRRYFTEEIKSARTILAWTAFSVLFFFLLGNAAAFNEFAPIHDAIYFHFANPGRWQVRLGRFLMPAYFLVRGSIADPLLILALSCAYLGISVCILVRLLGISSRLEIMLTGALLSVNLFTFEISAIHQYYADVFLLALLFASLGVLLSARGVTPRRGLAAAACFFVSFGIYPAFITWALCLFVLVWFLEGSADGWREAGIPGRAAAGLFILMLSGVLYLIASRMALRVLNLVPADNPWSMFTVGRLSPAEILGSAGLRYRNFLQLFFDGRPYAGLSSGIATSLLLLTAVTVFMMHSRKEVNAVLVILILLFPIGSRLCNIMTESDDSFRTMYAQFLLQPALLRLFFRERRRIGGRRVRGALTLLAAGLCLLVVYKNVQFNRTGFRYRRLLYERAVYHTDRVLEGLAAFSDDAFQRKLAVVGVFDIDVPEIPEFANYSRVGGMGRETGMTYEMLFRYYAKLSGRDVNWKQGYSDAVRESGELSALPCYPESGFIGEIGEYLVIRLSQ